MPFIQLAYSTTTYVSSDVLIYIAISIKDTNKVAGLFWFHGVQFHRS